MKYVLYVLKSLNYSKSYVGHTNNIERRLKEHNAGQCVFTSRFKPWEILHIEEYSSLELVVKREKYLKSAAGRRWMKKNLFSIM